jgi:hypothetical protein
MTPCFTADHNRHRPRRLAAALVVLSLALVALAALPAAEASGWGHRFMVYGRVLDADGNPAQDLTVTISAESLQSRDPQMTVRTDCNGIFYSQREESHPSDWNIFQDRLHLHYFPDLSDYAPDAEYIISTPYADYRDDALTPDEPLSTEQLRAYAVHAGPADELVQFAVAHVELDVSLAPSPECPPESDWKRTHIVVGKIQEIEGDHRRDLATTNPDEPVLVDVTLETTEGRRTMKVPTDSAGIYKATFENATVEPGAPITVLWNGHLREGEADNAFQLSRVDVIVGDDPSSDRMALWVFIGLLAVAGVAGLGIVMDARRAGRKKAQDDPFEDHPIEDPR